MSEKKRKSNERFREAVKVASEAYAYIKKNTSLKKWTVKESMCEDDEKAIKWRDIWYYCLSMANRGLLIRRAVNSFVDSIKNMVVGEFIFLVPKSV